MIMPVLAHRHQVQLAVLAPILQVTQLLLQNADEVVPVALPALGQVLPRALLLHILLRVHGDFHRVVQQLFTLEPQAVHGPVDGVKRRDSQLGQRSERLIKTRVDLCPERLPRSRLSSPSAWSQGLLHGRQLLARSGSDEACAS